MDSRVERESDNKLLSFSHSCRVVQETEIPEWEVTEFFFSNFTFHVNKTFKIRGRYLSLRYANEKILTSSAVKTTTIQIFCKLEISTYSEQNSAPMGAREQLEVSTGT